jgi:hypothetical protein
MSRKPSGALILWELWKLVRSTSLLDSRSFLNDDFPFTGYRLSGIMEALQSLSNPFSSSLWIFLSKFWVQEGTNEFSDGFLRQSSQVF